MNLYFQGSRSGPRCCDQWPKVQRRQVTSAVLQGSVLGPALLNSTHEWMTEQSTPSTSSQETERGRVADTPEGCATIQISCYTEKQAKRNLMNLEKIAKPYAWRGIM